VDSGNWPDAARSGPIELLVIIEPIYQVTCRICGPLDGGLHDNAEKAAADALAHRQSHEQGRYS
jgi:hypothetical protein